MVRSLHVPRCRFWTDDRLEAAVRGAQRPPDEARMAADPTSTLSASSSALSSLLSSASASSTVASSLSSALAASLTLSSTVALPSANSSSLSTSILEDPGPIYAAYTPGLFLIGLGITLLASLLNALGINIQKLDHVRHLSVPSSQRRPEFLRPVWVVGLLIYIVSQVLGSTLALQFMRAEYVAPLGSTSLVFNFILARWLLGTKITKLDLIGTFVVILGVVGVVGFGAIRTGGGIDQDANMSLETLKALWARWNWIVYFIGLQFVTGTMLWVASVMDETVFEREAVEDRRPGGGGADDEDGIAFVNRGGGRRSSRISFWSRLAGQQRRIRQAAKGGLESWASSRPDASIRKLCGLFWALTAGLLAGQTLLFAKSFVKVVTNATDASGRGSGSDLANPLTIFIGILLVFTAVAQIWCLNRGPSPLFLSLVAQLTMRGTGLRVYDSTLIVPVLFASYTASGWIGSLIYLDELSFYRSWVLGLVWFSIFVLVAGVVMLSSKKPEGRPRSQSKEGEGWRADLDPEGEAQESALGAAEEGKANRTPARGRDRSGSVLSLKELGQKLAEPFSARRRGSSAASGSFPTPRIPETSALPEEDEEDEGKGSTYAGAGEDEEDEIDRLEMVPAVGKTSPPGYSRAGVADDDDDEEDFGGFVDAKK